MGKEDMSSIKPTIDSGKDISGRKLLVRIVAKEPVIAKIIPEPVGVEVLCKLLLLGTAIANFFNIGIEFKNKI
tara:strand:+ start:184 stop:402 length:219 start_codon:yes stop_codon:yes gene_type:complete